MNPHSRSLALDVLETRDVPAAVDLRIVSYNIAHGHRAGLETVIQAIGNEIVTGNARPVDVIALQECLNQAEEPAQLVAGLNALFGPGAYAHGTLNALGNANLGGQPETPGVVYRTATVELLAEHAVPVTVGPTGVPRQPLRYTLHPVGRPAGEAFYLYNSHYKAGTDPATPSALSDEERRRIEAAAIRTDADALGEGANIIYAGDFNMQTSDELGYQRLLAAGPGQAFDPVGRPGNWHHNDAFRDLMNQSSTTDGTGNFASGGLDDRFDFLLMSGEFNDAIGLEYVTGSYHTFGNNGSVPLDSAINIPGNTALPGLANRTTILDLLATVSDNLPVVADLHFNTPPTISDVANQTTTVGTAVGPLPFTVGDVETPVAQLQVSALSSNGAIVSATNIVLAGTGASRAVSVVPTPGQAGVVTITLIVTDAGGLTATDTFTVTVNRPPPVVPPPVPVPPPNTTAFLLGGPLDGSVRPLLRDGTLAASLPAVPGLGVNARTALADVTGDGVLDFIAGAGPGSVPRLVVLDGTTGTALVAFSAFEDSFRGGVFVAAADIDGDGKAEVVVSPDQGGGPLAAIYSGAKLAAGLTGDAAQLLRYFAIDDPSFRGGARPTLGEITGDGKAELTVSAGFLGGPRITVWDGASVLAGTPRQLLNFFAFEDTLRNGAFVSAGDVTGDGRADLVFGGGPGGAPRVRLFDGAALLGEGLFANLDDVGSAQRANYFAGDSSLRGGVRLAMRDANADGKADLATGSGEGEASRVRVFLAGNLLANAAPVADQQLDPFGVTLANGVFVG